MKFIRDIIGDKRQASQSVDGTPMAAVPAEEAAGPRVAGDFSEIELSHTKEKAFGEFDVTSDAPAPVSAQSSTEADLGVSEEVAKFFTEDDDENLFGDDFDDDEFAGFDPVPQELGTASAEAVAPETTGDAAEELRNLEAEPPFRGSEPGLSDETGAGLNEAPRADSITLAGEAATPESPAQAEPVAAADHFAEELATSAPPEPAAHQKPEMSSVPLRSAQPSDKVSKVEPVPGPAPDLPGHVKVPQPAVGRGASRHGRVKTRLLGFNTAMETEVDPMSNNDKASAAPYTSFPVGWLIIVDGAGRGSAFTLFHGVSTIGRGEDQTVRLDFGDNSISRECHASVAYDDRQKGFFIGHGGKANIVRRNNRPVLSTEELAAGDIITIGETTLRFVPFCCPEFSWEEETQTGRSYANQA